MSKVQILATGSIDDCIDELALIMLQHERTKNIVLGAAVKMSAIKALGHQAKADAIVDRMKQMIQAN